MGENSFGCLRNRTAVVSGASSGIGQAILCELAEAGAEVIGTCAHSGDDLRKLCDALNVLGHRVIPFEGDLSDPETCDRLVEHAWDTLGTVDCWVNNAGADLLTGEAAKWDYFRKLDQLIGVDLKATMRLSRSAGARMRQRGSGSIINVGWDQAATGMGGDSGELFAAVKNAIMGFTRSLSVSLAPQVRANCVAPGWIQTAWGKQASDDWQQRVLRETPLKRWGTPADVAHVVRFLCSDQAAFLTGQTFNVNGGVVR